MPDANEVAALSYERVLAITSEAGDDALLRRAAEWAQATHAKLEVRPAPASSIFRRGETSKTDLVVLPHPAAGHRHERIFHAALAALDSALLLFQPSPPTGRILAATDLLDPEYPALTTAWELAQERCWELTTLHCASPWWNTPAAAPMMPFDLPAMIPLLPERLAKSADLALRRAHEQVGIDERGHPMIASAPASEMIVRSAAELEAELLVISAHRRSFLRRFFLGSTCTSVVRQIRCSALIVRQSTS